MFKKLIFLLLVLAFSSTELLATHLVGGSMSYQYIGTTPAGNVRYKITLTLYRDCASNGANGTPVPFDDDINICIFDNFGTKNLRLAPTFSKVSEKQVDPPGRTDCPETQSACLRQGVYEKLVDLPRSNFGYVLFWERCCRNDIKNLPNDGSGSPYQGQSYQATIPPTNTVNSSPYFSDVPVPFICVNDTIELSNIAKDPDGDALEYRLVDPWTGAEGNAVPDCAPRYVGPKSVRYNAGYSTALPYGVGGVSKINSSNGLTTFFSRQTGRFALAVEVIERRNGVILSRVRLELQILVIDCSKNAKPTIVGGDNQSYTIDAGDLLCFDVTANDADDHNIELTGTGQVLDGSNGFKGNKGTFTKKTGKSTVTSRFCWQTECLHAREEPYLMSFEAIDDGCPSKRKIVNVAIYVKPFNSDIRITGPTSVCENALSQIYTASNRVAGSVLKWSTSGNGSITSGAGTANVVVDWSGGLIGYIFIEEESVKGCPGSKDTIEVELRPSPPAPILIGNGDVCQNSIEIYDMTNLQAGNATLWGISNGSILAGQGTNKLTVNWGVRGPAKVFATQTNILGCVSDTGFLDITVHKPDPPVIDGIQSVCPYVQDVPYKVTNAQAGYTYNWSVRPNGVIGSGQGTDSITVNWGPLSTNFVSAMAFDQFGCPSNPDSIRVDVEYALDGEIPKEANSVCEFTQHDYYVRNTPKSVYRWTVSGGTIIAGDSGNVITVLWGAQGPGQVAVIEESLDTVNDVQCISLPNILNVTIHPLPTADKLNGIFAICQDQGALTPINIAGFTNSSFLWKINGDSTGILGQGTNTIQFPLSAEGTFIIEVLETTEFGCTRSIVDSTMIVHPKPRTTPILGPATICYPNYNNVDYSVTGFATSTFKWFVDGGVETPAPSTISSTSINWSGQQLNSIKVLETSDFGCLGDTQSLVVFADRPSIKFDVVTVNPPPGDDRSMRIYWTLNNAPRYNSKFEIQKRVRGSSANFTKVGEVNHPQDSFIEQPLNTDNTAFEYRIVGYDLCNQQIVSDSHVNVLLLGSKTGPYEVNMNFTDYSGWTNGVSEYELHRYLPGKSGWTKIETFADAQPNIDLANGLDNYTQCYRIKAIQSNSSGQDTFSWSNEVCFDFDPVVWIPNAFSVNGDGLNDDFRVTIGSIKSIEISVFNRWGELLYRSNDPNEGWDGTYKNENCQMDVYMYLVKFTGFDDKLYTQSGTLHLIR